MCSKASGQGRHGPAAGQRWICTWLRKREQSERETAGTTETQGMVTRIQHASSSTARKGKVGPVGQQQNGCSYGTQWLLRRFSARAFYDR